ncbi:MAG: hypothetical protein FWC43_08820 [Planctomycetaceae bacterium]|nr:hypothetical protein [Planctomycetaceae bacterium]
MISLTCSCGKPYTFKEKFLGQKFRCSDCATELTVEEQVEVPSIPEPDFPTELALNPEKAISLRAPQPKQQAVQQEAAPLTPDYENIVVPKPEPVFMGEEEYILISDSAPEFLNEIAMQVSEDTGPKSEALSMVLGRAAVAERLKHWEDTLGIRVTPVPVPVGPQNKRRKKREDSEIDQAQSQSQLPILHHTEQKNPNQLILTLLIIIGILVLGILILLFLKN